MNALSPFAAMLMALAGNALLSLGMVLQKRYIAWIKRGSAERSAKTISLWALGYILMNLQPIFIYFALSGLPANVVAATAGSNVAFTALLSWPLLGEGLTGRDIFWTCMLFLAVAAAGLRGGQASGLPGAAEVIMTGRAPLPAFYAAFALPAVFTSALFLLKKKSSEENLPPLRWATLIALAAGSFAGFMVLAMDGLRSLPELSLGGWLRSPFLYLYIAAGAIAFILNQISYREGTMAAVAPAYYGMQVLWPALAAYAVSGAAFDFLQLLAFILIAVSIFFMTRKNPP